jgi:hypothetical protein
MKTTATKIKTALPGKACFEETLQSGHILYDVCNDYSLDVSDGIGFDPSNYKAVKGQGGTLYLDKKYNELHYYSGKPGMRGQYIYGGTEA